MPPGGGLRRGPDPIYRIIRVMGEDGLYLLGGLLCAVYQLNPQPGDAALGGKKPPTPTPDLP